MRTLLSAICILGLSACSTHPVVSEIDEGKTRSLAGIPFRLLTNHRVEVYRLADEDDTYELVGTTVQRIADANRLYAMNYSGGPFATNSIKVVQNSDNTLKSVQVTSTDTTPATIDSLTSAVSNAKAAENAQKAASVSAAKAVVDADKAVRDAQKDLDGLSADASADTRALYQKLLDSAKQQAVVARIAAGGG